MTDIKKGSDTRQNGMKDKSNFSRTTVGTEHPSKEKSSKLQESEKSWNKNGGRLIDDV